MYRAGALLVVALAVWAAEPAVAQSVCTEQLQASEDAYLSGRFQEALDRASTCLETVEAGSVEHRDALLMLSRVYVILGQRENAELTLRQLYAEDPDFAPDTTRELELLLQLAAEVRASATEEMMEPEATTEPAPDTALASTELMAGPGVSDEGVQVAESAGTGAAETPAQEPEPTAPETAGPPVSRPYFAYEVTSLPKPEGGDGAIHRQVEYPSRARLRGTEGVVVVQFVVEADGSTSDILVVQGIGDGCDEAAVRAIRRTSFEPATLNGEPVPVQTTLSIGFYMNR